MQILFIIICAALIGIGLWFKSNRKDNIRKNIPFNYKSPGSLSTVNGVGVTMLGSFTYKDGITYSYYFVTVLFLPLIPIECYACQQEGNSYRFFGSQPWKAEEVLQIYSRWLWVVAAGLIISML